MWPVEHVGVVDSTMNLARQRALAGAQEGTTVVAQGQTAGRGRRGRVWHSEPGAGLWMTTILRPGRRDDVQTLGLVAGAAVWQALGVEGLGLKWPNDVEYKGRKLCGILLEGEGDVVLVGIGINVCANVPPDLAPHVASLDALVGGSAALLHTTLASVMGSLESCYHKWQTQGFVAILPVWQRADVLFGETVRAEVDGRWLQGEALGLAANGALRLKTASGEVLVYAGEVERVRAC